MPLSKSEISTLYGSRARHYDVTANLYYVLGFREWSYRKKAVRALQLSPGDTVVEIGCGTGLNFTLLQETVGPTGRIIGVDLTEAMLAQARERVERAGWDNVEIVHSDAAEYDFPVGVNGILSTFALTLVPEYDQVIARDLPAGATEWPLVIAAVAALTMTYGNLAALVQDNVVRLLAYSSIAQSGYFLLGVVALDQSGLALRSLVVFAAAYAAMNRGAIAVVALAGRDLRDFAGLGRSRPAAGAAMVVFLISLVGIPPLGGFVGKFLLCGAAIDAGFVWLAVVGILNSVLSLGVYLRIIVSMYQPEKGTPEPAKVAFAVWAISLFATVAVGVAAQVLLGRVS